MKNTLLFTYSTNILVLLLTVNKNDCLTPKNPKICHPILVTLLKMRPHYSQSSRENVTPSSGSSPLASYKEVHPPLGLHSVLFNNKQFFQMLEVLFSLQSGTKVVDTLV